MTLDKKDLDRISALKEKRMRLAELRENTEKRKSYGDELVQNINATLSLSLSLEDFDINRSLPIDFIWRADYSDCPGLVAASTSEVRAREIAACGDSIIGPMDGQVGFSDYSFVGVTELRAVTIPQLLNLALAINDSVLFCPVSYSSVIMLDHYKVRGHPYDVDFSIVIQGVELEKALAKCFGNVVIAAFL